MGKPRASAPGSATCPPYEGMDFEPNITLDLSKMLGMPILVHVFQRHSSLSRYFSAFGTSDRGNVCLAAILMVAIEHCPTALSWSNNNVSETSYQHTLYCGFRKSVSATSTVKAMIMICHHKRSIPRQVTVCNISSWETVLHVSYNWKVSAFLLSRALWDFFLRVIGRRALFRGRSYAL